MKRNPRPVLSLLFALACCVDVSCATDVDQDGRWLLGDAVKGGEELLLPQLGRNITAAYFAADSARKPIVVEFNTDATKVTLDVPEGDGGKVMLEVAEKTVQFPQGRIVLSALDAQVKGEKAKLETHPGNHRIGFWSNIADTVHWDYKATRPGMYDVELAYSLAGGGSEVEVAFGDEKTSGKLEPTGSWYRYSTTGLGRVYIAKPGKISVGVRGLSMKGGALMNLKAVTLRPAPEGKPVVQAEDGTVEMDSSAATVHSTLLQYERKPQKLCLGYWAKPEEWASFTFAIKSPGKFKVELTQGCGKGHGGSEVDVIVGGKTLEFTVDDTGGFQNWKVRELGEVSFEKAGEHRLEIRPKNKKGVAVMDVRRVRLVPLD